MEPKKLFRHSRNAHANSTGGGRGEPEEELAALQRSGDAAAREFAKRMVTEEGRKR